MVSVGSLYRNVDSYLNKHYYINNVANIDKCIYICDKYLGCEKLTNYNDYININNVEKTGIEMYNDLKEGIVFSHRVQRRKDYHRTGIDICITPSKSISVLLLSVEHRNQVLEAHRSAVQKALEYIQKNCIGYRGSFGKTYEKSDTCYFAVFEHYANRNHDVNLHTHINLFNITRNDKGKLVAVDFGKIYQDMEYINYIYNKELAKQLEKIGISVEVDEHCNNHFQGISQEIIDILSSRDKEINDFRENYFTDYLTTSQFVSVLTRKEKTENLSLSEVIKESIEKLRNNEVSFQFEKNNVKNKTIQNIDNSHIHGFFDYLYARKRITFSEKDIEKFCYIYRFSEKAQQQLRNEIYDICKECSNNRFGEKIFLNPIYRKNIEGVYRAIKQMKEYEVCDIEKSIRNENVEKLSNEQKQAFHYIENNYLTIIQGGAGTGKSFLAKCFKKEDVVSISFTGKAAVSLEAGKCFTIHSLLGLDIDGQKQYKPKTSALKGKVVFIDECSMINDKLFKELLMELRNAGASRIVLMGDYRQLSPVEGFSAWDVITSQFHTKGIEKIQRQQGKYLKIVEALKNGNERTKESVISHIERNAVILKEASNEEDRKENSKKFKNEIKDAILNCRKILVNDNEMIQLINNYGIETYEKYKDDEKYKNVIEKGIPVIITRNDYKFNVFNGNEGFLKGNYIILSDGRKINKEKVEWNYSFAMSITKAQGQTYDEVTYIHSEQDDLKSIYTAFTRARYNTKLVTVDFERFRDIVMNDTYESKHQKILKEFESKSTMEQSQQLQDQKRFSLGLGL